MSSSTITRGASDVLERVVPLVDVLEVAPDAITIFAGDRWQLDPAVVAALRDVAGIEPVAQGANRLRKVHASVALTTKFAAVD
jgi:hypothetical protein